MRTIVINTSVEAKDTRLNTLFEAPFDKSSLLWFDTKGLSLLKDYPKIIKQELIDNTDMVDKNYNLIVLVDLYPFPRSCEKDVSNIYRGLLTKYIISTLVEPLKSEFEIAPIAAAVFFVDSFKITQKHIDFKSSNPEQAEEEKRQKIVEQEKNNELVVTNNDGDIIETDCDLQKTDIKFTNDQKLIAEIFSWETPYEKDQIVWNKTLLGDLDFSNIFSDASKSIENSPCHIPVVNLGFEAVENLLGSWDLREYQNTDIKELTVNTNKLNGFKVSVFSFDIITENKQSIHEGYFNIYVNIFLCIQKKQIINNVVIYDKEQIKDLLFNALKKYMYFSEEKNIEVEREPITELFEARNEIYKKRKEIVFSITHQNNIDGIVDEVLKITNKEGALKAEEILPIFRPTKMDQRFGKIAAEIFNNYNTETIKKQNDTVVRECLKSFWNWRDKKTEESFIEDAKECLKEKSLKTAVNNNVNEDTDDNIQAEFLRISEELDDEYTKLVNDVTEAGHKLVVNENILLYTKKLIIEYMDIAKKGRRYLIAAIGAVIAVFISVFPYISIQSASINENILHKILYIVFTAGFVALYGAAVLTYSSLIAKKKRAIINNLEQCKKNSESDRKESIGLLIKYYKDTIIDAENHYLLKRELSRRNERNCRKLMMRNNHIVRLNFLERRVKNCITALKLDYEEADIRNAVDTSENFKIKLYAEKSYYDDANKQVYSILDFDDSEDERKEESK